MTIRWSAVTARPATHFYRGSTCADVRLLATTQDDATSFTDGGGGKPDSAPPPTRSTARTPGRWHAAYGGVIPHVSDNPGYYEDLAGSGGKPIERFNWGSSATLSLPLAAGLVTKRDLERGRDARTTSCLSVCPT